MVRHCLVLALALSAACAGGPTGAGAPSPSQTPAQPWPVVTRSHVDLWLHGYAMLLRDTATVPVFRRGYRDNIEALKRQRGISTQLDANRERLQSRLALSPSLTNGQFAPLYFASFDQMRQVIGYFIQAQGNPGATNDPTLRQYFAVLAQSFSTPADREWLQVFTQSLEDERIRFYQEYWTATHRERLPVVRAVDSLWQAGGGQRQRLQAFLNNTRQETGDFILALTLGGEGRTVNFSNRQNAVAVTLPESDPLEAVYVFAHEVVSSIVLTAVRDNTTPTEQRAGLADRYITVGTVRGGAMLLQRAAPELVAGYTRYYLRQAGVVTTGDISARLVSTFSLPELIRQAIDRQIEIVLGGI